ncbi:MAG: alpha/beta hydrolase [Actinomycetota bacterium]|nr:alpha/beta hydrolase [Actinomycetota bacterium]
MELDRRGLLLATAALGAAATTTALAPAANAGRLAATEAPFAAPRLSPTLLSLFAAPTFNDEALFAMGSASSHAAEVGEVLAISSLINQRTGNPENPAAEAFDAYYDVFGEYHQELAKQAKQAADGGHDITAQNRYMRASMYAAQQLFFVLGTTNGSRELEIFNSSQQHWIRAIENFDPKPTRFAVNSKFGRIPGTFFPSPKGSGRRPTVIISEGSDGQNVESMQFGVTAGLARGYNVVLFEGPGQMSLLFRKHIPFTAEWQEVVGPVLEWTKARSDVGKVALIGISFGGMLCIRPGARLKDLDALVLEPGAYDFTTMWTDQESMATVKETVKAPPQEKAVVQRELNEGFLQAWPSLPRSQQFEIYKRGEIFSPEVQKEARAGKPVSDYYQLLEKMLPFRYGADLRAMTTPTMVVANEGDEFFGDQPDKAFAMLETLPKSQKRLVHLTAKQGASLHDQPVGPQVAEEIVFDWLDDQVK